MGINWTSDFYQIYLLWPIIYKIANLIYQILRKYILAYL